MHGQVTLDLCGFRFASESLRTARLQVAYVKSPHAPVLSNEVVTYQPGGTTAAMTELREAIHRCPRAPVIGPVTGVPPIAYRLSELNDPRLLPGYVAVAARETAVIDGATKTQTNIAIYQTHGNTLSAVYEFGTEVPAGKTLVLAAAERSAQNLTNR